MERIVVGMADCRTAANPESVLVTYALGSCIGLTMYDPVAGIGGLLHFMLPDSNLDPARSRQNPHMFADTGIAWLLEKLLAQGASKRRLIACAAGAAQILDDKGVFEIGTRNYMATRRLLWKHGMLLQREAIGGTNFRTISLEIATGRLLLQEAGKHRELSPGWRMKGEQPWRTAS
ncbi:MAG TPA: chemotaxis protein CheD [Bryobacteraceae bacterium]|nr:chemotaxis protein CheD [Bryobacteraceae bacterium]